MATGAGSPGKSRDGWSVSLAVPERRAFERHAAPLGAEDQQAREPVVGEERRGDLAAERDHGVGRADRSGPELDRSL